MNHRIWSGVMAGGAMLLGMVARADVYVAPSPLYPPEGDRFSLIYSPEVGLANGSLPAPNGVHGDVLGIRNGLGQGATFENIGLEISSLAGIFGRYHGQLAYTNVGGISGVRLDPLGVGWAFPIIRGNHFGIEIEPMISVVDGVLLFTDDQDGKSNVTFFLSSGAEVQFNFYVDAFYFFASPLGVEVRYLEATSGSGSNVYTGADPYWRFRVGIGLQY
jgi:hypothetical protein